MARSQKNILPKSDPLWKAVGEEENARRLGDSDPRVQGAAKLSDRVTDMLESGGEIELRAADGTLQTVKIQGL